MSYVIFGRAIKTEYLTLGTLFATGGAVYASLGGKKDSASSSKPLAERVKEAVPINAGEEEQLINSIKNFIAEAEKEGGGSASLIRVLVLIHSAERPVCSYLDACQRHTSCAVTSGNRDFSRSHRYSLRRRSLCRTCFLFGS
ncbi:hypothetical protein DFJ58DRAFT_103244 [Suillus subalutaceus]|uniref:uncharacterized protein n=1 Tax=Suillus subalutaceus TaxID=48586 RepID=UPI001B85B3AA|nr:uncharacterized protein DFJ58DRAFT_103244 [Suillus subalutaceus]KAG1839761.1 hypothetical protein DFJ58DRAFT_103244 [Suillus subalutaceus]